jgi:hypothetical protein
MKHLILLLALSCYGQARAQVDRTRMGDDYYIYRAAFGTFDRYAYSTPEPRLSELLLIKGIGARAGFDTLDREVDSGFRRLLLTSVLFRNMTLHERFIYNIIRPRRYTQNCTLHVAYLANGTATSVKPAKRLYAQLPVPGSEYTWGDEQLSFFRDNRDSTLAWIREDIQRTRLVGLNYKTVLVEVNAVELIPDLLAIHDRQMVLRHEDDDIYTVIMQLMEKARYGPWLQTDLRKKLYGEDAVFWASVLCTPGLDLMIHRLGMGFYKTATICEP